MQHDEVTLCNICSDLVSWRKNEAFPLHLFQHVHPGDWIAVREVCERLGVAIRELGPTVFATWLPDPMAVAGYAVILFYDDESKWSMAAHYNRARLLGGGTPSQLHQPTIALVPGTDESNSVHAVPAVGL